MLNRTESNKDKLSPQEFNELVDRLITSARSVGSWSCEYSLESDPRKIKLVSNVVSDAIEETNEAKEKVLQAYKNAALP